MAIAAEEFFRAVRRPFDGWSQTPLCQYACSLDKRTELCTYMRMKTTSYTELRRSLAAMMDQVADDHEPLIITRGGGKPSAVLMSLEDYASYEETLYLLRSPANAARLVKAVEELDDGKGSERTLIE